MCLEIDVGPAQPAQLTAPQTSRRKVPHVCEPVLGESVEEPFDLGDGKGLHRHLADRQSVDERGHVVVHPKFDETIPNDFDLVDNDDSGRGL